MMYHHVLGVFLGFRGLLLRSKQGTVQLNPVVPAHATGNIDTVSAPTCHVTR